MTKNKPEKIAGFESGIITLKNSFEDERPRFLDIFIYVDPIRLKETLDAVYTYGYNAKPNKIPKISICK
jgi:hypothetical protein